MINMLSMVFMLLAIFGQINAVVAGSFLPHFSGERSAFQIKTTLRVQADLYYGAEDEETEPIEAEFYLLNESLINILKKSKFKPVYTDKKRHRVKEEDYLEAAAKILNRQANEEEEILAFLITGAIERHQSSYLHTNQSGRGYFKTIKPGDYYVFGIKKINDQTIVWHLPIAVKMGINRINLDQNNAAAIFESE